MQKASHLLVVALSLSSFSVSAADNPSADLRQLEGFRLVLDQKVAELVDTPERPVLEGWMRYAATRASAYDELARRGRRNPAVEDYEIELAARKALAVFWAAQRQTSSAPPNPYLDKLVDIDEAGFMEEYVLYFFVKPGWTLSAASLAQIDFEEFATWGNANLGGIDHPTLATLESTLNDRPQTTSQPGATLPDPAQYTASGASCSTGREDLIAAGERWLEESKLLDGAPLAAADRNEFLYGLTRHLRAEPFRSEGMAWVADRPGRLTYLAGFCEVEATNIFEAERWLRIATSLRPFDAGIQAELVHALIFMRRFTDADNMVDQIMATTENPCDLAGAWRRRGYIRFEEGELEESKAAYLKSLEYDPGNPLALSELQLLDERLLRSDRVTLPAAGPTTYTTIQTCQRE